MPRWPLAGGVELVPRVGGGACRSHAHLCGGRAPRGPSSSARAGLRRPKRGRGVDASAALPHRRAGLAQGRGAGRGAGR